MGPARRARLLGECAGRLDARAYACAGAGRSTHSLCARAPMVVAAPGAMEDMVAEFEEKGVVVVPNMFSADEIEEMRSEADYIAGVSLNAVRFSSHESRSGTHSRSGS